MAYDVSPVGDLVWYYQEADADLGERSSFEAMRNQIALGGRTTSSPTIQWPEELRCSAAARQVAIRQALRAVTPCLQAVIEAAYELRQYDQQLESMYGKLVVGVIMRAESVQRSLRATWAYRFTEALQCALMRLSGNRMRPPEWSALAAEDAVANNNENLVESLKMAGEILLSDAHTEYKQARRDRFVIPIKPTPVPRALVPVAQAGAGKRKLCPVPVASHAA